jgi:biopolymer transport protein ExbD
MSKKVAIQEELSPNLIPMVDIMFLLLLFFMLGADMGQRELEEVMLPKAMSVKEDKETKGKTSDRLTLNVYHRYANEVKCAAYAAQQVCRVNEHWRVGVKGKDVSQPERLGAMLKKEADLERTDKAHPEISERKVMIRADLSSPFDLVQRTMNACAKVGIYKIECGAARPNDNEKKKTVN